MVIRCVVVSLWLFLFVYLCALVPLWLKPPLLNAKYHTERTTLDIAGLAVQLDRIRNLDDLMNELIAKGEAHEDYQDDRLPYWADLWHAAIGLARVVAREKLVAPGQRVTEIGCGLGLPGVTAGVLGAEVTFTDYMPEALQFAEHNWQLNIDRPVRLLQMDWRAPNPGARADVLLAADIAYEKRFFEPLYQTFRTLLPTGGTLLLSEPGRGVATPFLENLPKEGFRLEGEWTEPVRLNEFEIKVRVYRGVRSEE